jgi:serine protease Do
MIKFNLCVAVIFISFYASAEIYQWTDKDGKVHYGEQKIGIDKNDVKAVEIRDKYHIPSVDTLVAIKYSSSMAHRQISFMNIKLVLPDSDTENVRIGRVTCGAPIDLYWKKGIVDLLKPETIESSIATFANFGYSVRNAIKGAESPSSLSLTAEIVDFKINLCPSKQSKDISQNATFIKIKWTLLEPLSDKVLFAAETSGSHDALSARAIKNGENISFSSALAQATNNLLADPNFVGALAPVDLQTMAKTFDKKLAIKIQYGNGKSTFKESTKRLMKNTVIVKTKEGFGSGVVINRSGYVLTNSHVIGKEKTFKVLVDGESVDAELIRNEVVRDVALIRMVGGFSALSGVEVSHDMPSIGDEIYIIGAPLSLENSQTTTKGIISAFRKMHGLKYFQTDAAVNHGSSGGPVFNEKGELIALTVAGLLTRDGAGLGINYLIPVDDVFRYLNIGSAASAEGAAESSTWLDVFPVDDGSLLSKMKGAGTYLLHWLDSPLVPSLSSASKYKNEDTPLQSGLSNLPAIMEKSYVTRAKFAEALILVSNLRMPMLEYYETHNEWPTDFSDINISGDTLTHSGLIESIELRSGGALHANLSEATFGAGKHFQFAPDNETSSAMAMNWSCRTNLDKALWTGSCVAY